MKLKSRSTVCAPAFFWGCCKIPCEIKKQHLGSAEKVVGTNKHDSASAFIAVCESARNLNAPHHAPRSGAVNQANFTSLTKSEIEMEGLIHKFDDKK